MVTPEIMIFIDGKEAVVLLAFDDINRGFNF